MHSRDHNYDSVLRRSNVVTFENRRKIADVLFLFKVLRNFVDCPRLVQPINFNARLAAFA